MIVRVCVLVFLCVLSSSISFSQNISISIFHEQKIDVFLFTAHNGKYDVIVDNTIDFVIEEGQTVEFSIKSGVFRAGKKNYKADKVIHLRGAYDICFFTITHPSRRIPQRSYDNDMYVSVNKGELRLINDVNFEKYIAGVVEAEGGSRAHIEFYKAQALLCRTYAAKYYIKHLHEGFNLCDAEHCQAYKGRCTHNPAILNAAFETSGLVVVDSTHTLISATYYANSGGQTANSEDVWITRVPYLRSVQDTFSVGMPGYSWRREIPLNDWTKYLAAKGFVMDPYKEYVPFTIDTTFETIYTVIDMRIDSVKKEILHVDTIWNMPVLYDSVGIVHIADTSLTQNHMLDFVIDSVYSIQWSIDTVRNDTIYSQILTIDTVFHKKTEVHFPLDFTFSQPERAKYFEFRGNDTLLRLRTIRSEWRLRSTFFTMYQQNNTVVIEGFGYGHGVGLSQEGAMNMALQGYLYDQIIKFYFRGVLIKSMRDLDFYKIE